MREQRHYGLVENPDSLLFWRDKLPLQARIEEKGLFYDRLYRHAVRYRPACDPTSTPEDELACGQSLMHKIIVVTTTPPTARTTADWFTTVVGPLLVMVMCALELFSMLLILASMTRSRILRDASKAYPDCIANVEETR